MSNSFDTSFYLYHAAGDQARASCAFLAMSSDQKIQVMKDLLSLQTGLSQHKQVWRHFLSQDLPSIDLATFQRVTHMVLGLDDPSVVKALFQSTWGQTHMPSCTQASKMLACLWTISQGQAGVGKSFREFLKYQPTNKDVNYVLDALFYFGCDDKATAYFHLLPKTSPSPLKWCFQYHQEEKIVDIYNKLPPFLRQGSLLHCLEYGKEDAFLTLYALPSTFSTEEITHLCQHALMRKLYRVSETLLPQADMNALGVFVVQSIEQSDEEMMRRLAPFVGDVDGVGRIIKARSRPNDLPSGWQVFQNLVTKEHLTEALEETSAKCSSSVRKM